MNVGVVPRGCTECYDSVELAVVQRDLPNDRVGNEDACSEGKFFYALFSKDYRGSIGYE